MLVKLKRNWFAPDGSLYRKSDFGTEIPGHFADKLPKDAKRLDGKPVAAPAREETLKDHDPQRAAADAEAAAAAEAEKTRKANAERLAQQLAAEKGKK